MKGGISMMNRKTCMFLAAMAGFLLTCTSHGQVTVKLATLAPDGILSAA